VREVTMPALERGFAKSGRSRADFEVGGPLFVVTGTDDEELEKARVGTSSRSLSTARRRPTAASSSSTAGATSKAS